LRNKFPRLFDLAVNQDASVEEMARLGWEDGGEVWVWRRCLLAWEEENVRECTILLHNTVLQEHSHDTWTWLLDPTRGYSVRGAYRFLTSMDAPVVGNFADDYWHKTIPSKVSLFA